MTNDFAKSLDEILSGRGQEYGDSSRMLTKIAAMWSLILGHNITPKEVGLMMVGMKILREGQRHKKDNLLDIAGYAAILSDLFDKSQQL